MDSDGLGWTRMDSDPRVVGCDGGVAAEDLRLTTDSAEPTSRPGAPMAT